MFEREGILLSQKQKTETENKLFIDDYLQRRERLLFLETYFEKVRG